MTSRNDTAPLTMYRQQGARDSVQSGCTPIDQRTGYVARPAACFGNAAAGRHWQPGVGGRPPAALVTGHCQRLCQGEQPATQEGIRRVVLWWAGLPTSRAERSLKPPSSRDAPWLYQSLPRRSSASPSIANTEKRVDPTDLTTIHKACSTVSTPTSVGGRSESIEQNGAAI